MWTITYRTYTKEIRSRMSITHQIQQDLIFQSLYSRWRRDRDKISWEWEREMPRRREEIYIATPSFLLSIFGPCTIQQRWSTISPVASDIWWGRGQWNLYAQNPGNDLFLRFDRPVRRSAWLYSYMFRLAGHYGSSGMAGQKKGGRGEATTKLRRLDKSLPYQARKKRLFPSSCFPCVLHRRSPDVSLIPPEWISWS